MPSKAAGLPRQGPQKGWRRRVRVTPGDASGGGVRETDDLEGGLPSKEARDGPKKSKTYNSGYSHVVTHRTTSPPVRSLSSGERTGSSVLCDLWSYVPVRQNAKYIYRARGHFEPALGDSQHREAPILGPSTRPPPGLRPGLVGGCLRTPHLPPGAIPRTPGLLATAVGQRRAASGRSPLPTSRPWLRGLALIGPGAPPPPSLASPPFPSSLLLSLPLLPLLLPPPPNAPAARNF